MDFSAVMRHVNDAIRTIAPEDSVEALQRDGVAVLTGNAVFADGASLNVDGREIRFRQAIIGTGARPCELDVEGADTVEALTSDTVWSLETLPERLLIIGGGCMGCELGQAMAQGHRRGCDCRLHPDHH